MAFRALASAALSASVRLGERIPGLRSVFGPSRRVSSAPAPERRLDEAFTGTRDLRARLGETEAQLRTIAEHAPIALMRFDRAFRVTYLNSCGERMAGVPAGAFLGRTNREAGMPPHLCDLWEGALGRVFDEGAPHALEFELDGPEGKKTFFLRLSPEFEAGGRAVRSVLGVSTDITELVLSRDERVRLISELETLYDSAPVGLAFFDRDLRYVRINAHLAAMNGIPAADHLGKTVREVLPKLADQFEPMLLNMIRTGEPLRDLRFEGETPAHPGERRVWHENWLPLKDETGTVWGINVVVADVTHRERLTEDLRRSQEELERRVEERSAELARHAEALERERLRRIEEDIQAEKMEALGRLAGGIAHDLNNALAPILINAEMAFFESAPGGPAQELLQTIIESTIRGKNLVRQILTFSAQRASERKPVRIGPLVEESVKFVRAAIPPTVEIRTAVRDRLGMVLADATQIDQVVVNLATNAAHALRDAGGIMEIELDAVDGREDDLDGPASGRWLRLRVSDTGPGMPPEVLHRVFDPFFTTKGFGEGTGLGLAVVHGIVRQHGGEVRASSEPGKGSVFSVFLPWLRDEVPSPAEPAETMPLGKELVLFVEDEETQVRSWKPALEKLGYHVIARTDPWEGLETFLYRPEIFDLILLDQVMPGLSGTAFAAEARRARPDIPIVLYTGFGADLDAEEVRRLGISEVVLKPATMASLAGALRKALDARATAPPVPSRPGRV